MDLVFVRELTGGIYFGEKHRDATSASDLCSYTVAEIERIVRARGAAGAGTARQADLDRQVERARDLAPVARGDRRAWCSTEFPTSTLEHMLVDAAAMHLIRRPRDFDVLVTENMFGDILTDEASMLAGSLGLLPSASLGGSGPGLYEPIHGSAPDIAGRGIANPCGTILSVALLLRHSLRLPAEAAALERAVSAGARGRCAHRRSRRARRARASRPGRWRTRCSAACGGLDRLTGRQHGGGPFQRPRQILAQILQTLDADRQADAVRR